MFSILEQVSSSCHPVARSNTAASFDRVTHFVTWEAFGLSSVFYILTCCDGNSLRILLYELSTSIHELPLKNMINDQRIIDLNFRNKIWVAYLGLLIKPP